MTDNLKIIRVVTHQSGPHRYRVATVEEAIAVCRECHPTEQVIDAYDESMWSVYGGMKPTGTPSDL